MQSQRVVMIRTFFPAKKNKKKKKNQSSCTTDKHNAFCIHNVYSQVILATPSLS